MNKDEQFIFNNDTFEEQEIAQVSALMENEAVIRKHREQLAKKQSKPSLDECIECGNPIPKLRQKLVPGVELCVECANVREKLN